MKRLLLLLTLILISCNKNETNTQNSTKKDSVGGSLATFTLKGNYLYVVDKQNLNVFSLQNEKQPSQINSVPVGFNIETLYAQNDYLFIGSSSAMYIYSLENPEIPKLLTRASHLTSCDPVVANDTHAFVTLHTSSVCSGQINALQIYDIQDIKKPKLIHTRNLVRPKGLAIHGQFLVICDDDLKIFSIENPEEPKFVRAISKTYNDVIFSENRLFAFGDNEIAQYSYSADFETITAISSLKL